MQERKSCLDKNLNRQSKSSASTNWSKRLSCKNDTSEKRQRRTWRRQRRSSKSPSTTFNRRKRSTMKCTTKTCRCTRRWLLWTLIHNQKLILNRQELQQTRAWSRRCNLNWPRRTQKLHSWRSCALIITSSQKDKIKNLQSRWIIKMRDLIF